MGSTVDKIRAPDSALARAITELVKDTESPLLFHHWEPSFKPGNFCAVIRGSAWRG